MGFTSFWWTQSLGDLNRVYIVLVDTGLWDINVVYIVLVDTAAWGPKWGLHRFGGHEVLAS
jgi:hypothetical protein